MTDMTNLGVSLMPSVARHIIEELFKQQPTWKRDTLVGEVRRIHAERGGLPGNQDPSSVVTKALRYLQEDGTIRNQAYGIWTAVSDDVVITPTEAASTNDAVDSADDTTATAEITIGTGDETVYVYFNPNDRELALLKGTDVWECKIGRTGASEARTRIRTQGTVTALSHPPIIGLIIQTHDSAALEKALHASLRLNDAGVPDSPGAEWFITSPERIAKWFGRFEGALGLLNTNDKGCAEQIGYESRSQAQISPLPPKS